MKPEATEEPKQPVTMEDICAFLSDMMHNASGERDRLHAAEMLTKLVQKGDTGSGWVVLEQ